MKTGREAGFSIIYLIAALAVAAGIATAVTVMTPSSTMTEVQENRFGQAYYAAYSGLQYLKYAENKVYKTVEEFAGEVNGTFGVGDAGWYSIKVSYDSLYPLRYTIEYVVGGVGSQGDGQLQNILLVSNQSRTFVPRVDSGSLTPTGASKFVLFSGGAGVALQGAASVVGDMYAGSVQTEQSTIDGNIISSGNVELGFATNVTKNVCSLGSVSLDQSTVGGDINAVGNVYLKFKSTVYGNIYTKGDVIMEGSVRVDGEIHAQGKVDIGFSDAIAGGVGSTGVYANKDISFVGGSGSVLQNAYSGQTITMSWGSSIVKSAVAKKVSVIKGSSVGAKIETTTYPPNIKPTLPTACAVENTPKENASISIGSKNITVPWADTTYGLRNPLSPGAYGNLTLKGASPITLTAGTYYFNTITLGWGSVINLNVSNGDITIFVLGNVDFDSSGGVQVCSDGVTWKDMSNTEMANAAKVYLESHGQIALEWGTNWFGTLLSSKQIVFKGANSIIGSYATTSGSLPVNWAANIVYVPSNYAMAHW